MANRAWPVNLGAVAAIAVALLFPSARADAHPEYAPSTVNHYLKLDLVSASQLRLAYTVMVGPAPAAAARRAADADANGHLSAVEARALGEKQRDAVVAGLAVDVDGKRIALAFEPPEVGLAGDEVAPSPYSVDLIAHLPLPLAGAGRHRLRIDDATADPLLGDSEIRIEESPATRLVTAHRGSSSDGEASAGSERETRFLFHGPRFSALEDRSISVVFEGKALGAPSSGANAGAGGREPRPGRLPKLVLVVVALGITLVIARRMLRARRR